MHIFSETAAVRRGAQSDTFGPQSGATLINANVQTVKDVAVQNATGRMLALKDKGGEIKVLVPADTPVV